MLVRDVFRSRSNLAVSLRIAIIRKSTNNPSVASTGWLRSQETRGEMAKLMSIPSGRLLLTGPPKTVLSLEVVVARGIVLIRKPTIPGMAVMMKTQ